MPVYSWKGLDFQGKVYNGFLSAASLDELTLLLEKRSIGLITAHTVELSPILSSAGQDRFFSDLFSLLKAHIPVHTALLLIERLHKGTGIARAAEAVALSVERGMALSEALIVHRSLDEFGFFVLRAGEQSGSLAKALEELVRHKAHNDLLRKKAKAAVRIPTLTFLFFMLCLSVILLLIVPRLEVYCSSRFESLPVVTQGVIRLSRCFRSLESLSFIFFKIVPFFCIVLLSKQSKHGRNLKDFCLVRTPFIGSFFIALYRAYVLRGMSLLLMRGVPVVQALEVCKSVQGSVTVTKALELIIYRVQQGGRLSHAFENTIFFSDELAAFLSLGECSGQLPSMIERAADLFQQKIYRELDQTITYIQPMLLVCLGLLIGGLVYAVYIPLLTLSCSFEQGLFNL